MIHLDTNYLVALVAKKSRLQPTVERWLAGGETFAASSIAWSEFVTGPITSEEGQVAVALVQNRIIPFGHAEANLAARLFNQAGRRRELRIDSFIAAVAISSSAPLATENRRDFSPFVAGGLRLV